MPRPLRVLFINRMASMVRGGGETFDLEMARHLEALGVETSFLTGIPLLGRATSPLDHARGHVIRSPYTGWFPWDRVWQGWRLRVWDFRCFERAAAAWATRRQEEFDLLQICEMPPLIDDLRRAGWTKPIVIRATAFDYHDPDGAVLRASAAIAGGATVERMRKRTGRAVIDIPNGVDTAHFRPGPSPFRAEQGIPPDAFLVLCVARLQQVKNHPLLLRAFAELRRTEPSAVLVLVGSGPLERELRTLASTLGLDGAVRFLGEVPYARVADVYRAADAHALASFHESFSFATLEAMASGLPCVVTETEWIPRLLGRGEGGRVTPNDDAPAFAAALIELARDPTARARLGARNRQAAEQRHGWRASAEKLLGVYESLPGVSASILLGSPIGGG